MRRERKKVEAQERGKDKGGGLGGGEKRMGRKRKKVEATEREREGQRRWTGSGREANEKRAEE
eukprot:3444693-Pleurochrysis_carterae.AAC.1